MLSVSAGHHWRYLTDQVAKGKENYYTQATAEGEPPGVWRGDGAAKLGLTGQVTEQQMSALYGNFIDPRDPDFGNEARWDEAEKLGQPPRKFRDREAILLGMLVKEPNATPERVEELKAMAVKQERHAVAFIDLTFSPPKSVSVLHTAFRAQEAAATRDGNDKGAAMWRERAEAVERAVWAGNDAMLTYMQREAGYSRTGYHGPRGPGGESTGRYVDAHEWTVASFFQHTARPTADRGEQPNLHIHNAVLNRVECPDGTWRTLDSRGVHKVRGAAGATAERVMFEDLAQSIGAEAVTRPDGKAREIVGIPATVRDWFSARRPAIVERTRQYAEAFEAKKGRKPNALELTRLAAKATKYTREAKLKNAPTAEARVEQWADDVRNHVDSTLTECANDAFGRIKNAAAAGESFKPGEVIENAVAEVQATKSEWTRYDLLRAIDKHLPDKLGGISADQYDRVRERIADRALSPDRNKTGAEDEVWRLSAPDLVAPPAELCRNDGSSMYRPHGSDRYSTRGQLGAETRLEAAAKVDEGAACVSDKRAAELLGKINESLAKDGNTLGADQAKALHGLLTSGRPVESLIGPPGTGKSFTIGTLADLWEDQLNHGRVFGLALAQNAAGVLAEEGLDRSDNITNWLLIQERIDRQKASAAETAAWQLNRGDLVLIDEAGMAGTPDLAEVQRRATAAGAKVVYTGDPRQLSAVGAGGAFALVADAGTKYELDEVRRFHADWEKRASLRLRDGDTSVLSLYERHGRLVDAGTLEQARQQITDAWLSDVLRNKPTAMVVDTNDEAAELCGEAQQRLIDLGKVRTPGSETLADGNKAGIGDLIQARKNDRTIRSLTAGTWVVNRRNYRVTAISEDGSITARRVRGWSKDGEKLGAEITLPAGYLADHAALGYATTAHGIQGRTLGDRKTAGTCHQIVTSRTGADALLVGQTRGTSANLAYVVTKEPADWRAPEEIAEAEETTPAADDPTPAKILGDIVERYEPDVSALARWRQELEHAESLIHLGAIWTDVQQQIVEPRYEKILRDILPEHQADQVMSEDARGPLWRMIRSTEIAGNNAREVLSTTIAQRELHSADSIAEVLHWRIKGTYAQSSVPIQDTYPDRSIRDEGNIPEFGLELADVMENRVAVLGEQIAADPPAWAVKHLGRVPFDPVARSDWETAAGRVAAYREQYNYTSDRDAIGPAPKAGQPEARGTWYAAHRALGSPEERPDEAVMSDAQLREQINAYTREEQWAPHWVGEDLQQASESSRLMREQGYLTAAAARAETDPAKAKQLHRAAGEWFALAGHSTRDRKKLEYIDDKRADWYLETGDTRDAADRARDELASRGRVPDSEMTAQQLEQREYLNDLVEYGALNEQQRDMLMADRAAPAMWQAIHKARTDGLDVDGPNGMVAAVIRQRALDTDKDNPAESLAQVIHWRVTTTASDDEKANQWREQAKARAEAAEPKTADERAVMERHAMFEKSQDLFNQARLLPEGDPRREELNREATRLQHEFMAQVERELERQAQEQQPPVSEREEAEELVQEETSERPAQEQQPPVPEREVVDEHQADDTIAEPVTAEQDQEPAPEVVDERAVEEPIAETEPVSERTADEPAEKLEEPAPVTEPREQETAEHQGPEQRPVPKREVVDQDQPAEPVTERDTTPDPRPTRAEQLERAREAERILEQRQARSADEADEIAERQRRTIQAEEEFTAQREREAEGPTLSL